MARPFPCRPLFGPGRPAAPPPDSGQPPPTPGKSHHLTPAPARVPRTAALPATGTLPATVTAAPAPVPQDAPAGLRRFPAGPRVPAGPLVPTPPLTPAVAGSVNLTIPLQTLLGMSSQPGEVAGLGPLTPAATSGILAAARAGGAAVRWCVTVTDHHGRPAGHGCAAGQPQQPNPGRWGFSLTVQALETGDCAHTRQSAADKPPPKLRHLIQARHRTCCFPGCGRPARLCELDHTLAYNAGGRTCQCNLAETCNL